MSEVRRVLQNLSPQTRYVVRVRAINEFGLPSPWSDALDFTTEHDSSVPQGPTGLILQFESPSLIASWETVSTNTDGTPFSDFSAFEVTLEAGGSTKTYRTTSPNFVYTLRQNQLDFGAPQPVLDVSVRAIDVTNNRSQPLSGTAVNSVPPTPTDPPAVATGFTLVNITMSAPAGMQDLEGFDLYHATSVGGPYSLLASTSGGVNSYAHAVGQGSAHHYRYKVRDVFGQVSPGFSPTVSTTAFTAQSADTEPPEPVTNLRVLLDGLAPDGLAFVDLAWDFNSAADLGYYELRWRRPADAAFSSAMVGTAFTSRRITNLQPGLLYEFQIRAVDVSNNASAWAPITPLAHTMPQDLSAPAAPGNLRLTPGIRSLILQWDANTEADFSTYEIHVGTTPGFAPTASNLYSRRGAGTVETINKYWTGSAWADLVPGTTYYVKMFALDRAGNRSPVSVEASATTGRVVSADVAFSIGGGNILINSGGEGADISAWAPYSDAVVSRDTTAANVLRGSAALKVDVPAPDVHSTHGIFQVTSVVVPANTKVIASAWVKMPVGVVFSIAGRISTAGGANLAEELSLGTYTGTGEYQYVVTNGSYTRGDQSFRPGFEIRVTGTNSISFWVDNAQVELGDVATAYAPKPNEILPGSITSTEIADNAITTPKLVANAVVSAKIAADAIGAREIAANQITAEHIVSDSVTADKLTTSELLASITVSGSIRTALNGARMEMNSSGLVGYANDGTTKNLEYRNTDSPPGLVVSNTGYVKSTNHIAGVSGWYFGAGAGSGLLEINEGVIRARALQIGVSNENLVPNSSFENYPASGPDAGLAVGWKEYPANTRSPLTHTFAPATGGGDFLYQSKSQRMTVVGSPTSAGVMATISLGNTPIEASVANPAFVTVSFWVKQAALNSRVARVALKDVTNNLTFTVATAVNLDTAWRRVVHTVTLTQTTNQVEIHCYVQNTSGNLTAGEVFFFEGAQLELSSYVSAYKPTTLEIPDSYIQSAYIAGLTADKIQSGSISTALIDIASTGYIQSFNYSTTPGSEAGYRLAASKLTMQNGGVEILGLGKSGSYGGITLDSTNMKAVYAGVEQLLVNSTGVYLGGNNAATADVFVDTAQNRTYISNSALFRSTGGSHTLEIDTAAAGLGSKIMRLYDAGLVDSFYLTNDGLGFFAKGVVGTIGGAGGNRVKNASFESKASSSSSAIASSNADNLNYWLRWNSNADTNPTITRVAGGIHGGYSARIVWTTNSGGGRKGIAQDPWVGGPNSSTWPANSTWMLSFWVYNQVANVGVPAVEFSGAGFTTTNIAVPTPQVSAWQRYVYKITAPGSATASTMRLGWTHANGDLLIDGVQVERGEIASTFSPMPDEVLPIGNAGSIQGDDLRSSNYVAGSSGWAIKGDGNAEFNDVTARGRIEVAAGGYTMQFGKDVGPSAGHHGLSLHSGDFNNIFLRRASDNRIFFRVNSGGTGGSLTFEPNSPTDGTLTVTGTVNANAGNFTGTVTVGGTLNVTGTISGSGTIQGPTIQTASSGRRVRLTTNSLGQIEFYAGIGGETVGFVGTDNFGSRATWTAQGPTYPGYLKPAIFLHSGPGAYGGNSSFSVESIGETVVNSVLYAWQLALGTRTWDAESVTCHGGSAGISLRDRDASTTTNRRWVVYNQATQLRFWYQDRIRAYVHNNGIKAYNIDGNNSTGWDLYALISENVGGEIPGWDAQNAGISFHVPQDAQAAVLKMHSPLGQAIECRNSNDTAFVTIKAANTSWSSQIRHKQEIRSMTETDGDLLDKVKRLKPLRFKRPHASLCAACHGKGHKAKERRGFGAAVEFENEPCPKCCGDGVPGQINNPAIDATEDTDFLGFAAEDIAELWPEAVAWEPSDPTDRMSTPQPQAVMGYELVTIALATVQKLLEKVEVLEESVASLLEPKK